MSTEFTFSAMAQDTKEQLLNTPALLTIYAANHQGKLTKEEIHASVDYGKTETYASPEFLHEYFKDVVNGFQRKIEQVLENLPYDKSERRREILKRLVPIKLYLDTLDDALAHEIKKALLGFVDHVYFASESIFENVLFPIFSEYLNGHNLDTLKKGLL